MESADIVVVGGGPAGLAVAVGAALAGLRTVVLERGSYPLDKACGEGLMPAGLAALQELGVLAHLAAAECARIEGVRYVQEDGSAVEGRLPTPGLGVRRLALVDALLSRAKAVGVSVRERAALRSHQLASGGMRLQTDEQTFHAQVVVAADGLASPLRKAAGLEGPPGRRRRFGLRQHFHCAPWTSFVEVHLSSRVEAYVTPTGPGRVGVAFLWEDGAVDGRVGFPVLLARFPALASRLAGAASASEVRGAGPFFQRARAQSAERLVLAGDAGGYVDAITGEGLSVAFDAARALVKLLPEAVRQGGARATFRPYELEHRRIFRRYAWTAKVVLGLARRPALRRPLLRALGQFPGLFETTLRLALGPPSPSFLLPASGGEEDCARGPRVDSPSCCSIAPDVIPVGTSAPSPAGNASDAGAARSG